MLLSPKCHILKARAIDSGGVKTATGSLFQGAAGAASSPAWAPLPFVLWLQRWVKCVSVCGLATEVHLKCRSNSALFCKSKPLYDGDLQAHQPPENIASDFLRVTLNHPDGCNSSYVSMTLGNSQTLNITIIKKQKRLNLENMAKRFWCSNEVVLLTYPCGGASLKCHWNTSIAFTSWRMCRMTSRD